MKPKVVWIQMYDDFSGVDKLFLSKDEAKLYHKWIGATADIQKHVIDESHDEVFREGKKS